MPCFEPDLDDFNPIENELKKIKGYLCALLNELDRRGITDEVVSSASIKGKAPLLMRFWEEHKREDDMRIRDKLRKYSPDEITIIKALLNSEEFKD